MAITNMSSIFDKLQEYIDGKLTDLDTNLKELFDEYHLKAIFELSPHLVIVSENIEDINIVSHSIKDVIECANGMTYIKVAPDAAQIAIDKAAEALVSATNAYEWASNPEDTPVDDGIYPVGYSAYHWAMKSEESALTVSNFDGGNASTVISVDDITIDGGDAQWQ